MEELKKQRNKLILELRKTNNPIKQLKIKLEIDLLEEKMSNDSQSK